LNGFFLKLLCFKIRRSALERDKIMDKHYSFLDIEPEMIKKWDSITDSPHSNAKPLYTILMPPPNVTGALHVGHALSSTLQDILIRFHRMRGASVCWLPGTDHAGISTQMMVERALGKEGLTRREMGREAFLRRVWDWKERTEACILDQMKRLGFSADWSRCVFTLDEIPSAHVVDAFLHLYEKGWIVRAERLVNWDPSLQTVLSDLEVVMVEEKGSLWTVAYDLEGGGTIHIATTRPETILGDGAIAVHPKDERYAALIGQNVRVPLVDRWVPIIADEGVDPNKGTGALKVTAAHDFLDFQMTQRYAKANPEKEPLFSLSIFDAYACLNETVPETFRGLDRYVARKAVLEALGPRVTHTEAITHMVPHSERSGATLEPRLTSQWFIDTTVMAKNALDAVKEGKTTFVPHEWNAYYFGWLKDPQPWCISRQLWWGHRIPAWFGPENSLFVARTAEESHRQAKAQFGKEVELHQDEDVLDTWFSSGLWPLLTFKEGRYPTNVLVTGFDIIFFWVARMMMLSVEMTGEVPFHTVVIHPLVRDEKGKKMSKTKGNVIEPMSVAQTYGVDALRFSLALSALDAQYTRFGLKDVEHARNFMTKVWNVARFLQIHNVPLSDTLPNTMGAISRWFVHACNQQQKKLTEQLERYAFHEAASGLYHFVWHLFCDWFVEFSKDALAHEEQKEEVRAVLGWSFSRILHFLHPFVPFITEKLWEEMTTQDSSALWISPWPKTLEMQEEPSIQWIMNLMGEVRKLRAGFLLQASVPLSIFMYELSPEERVILAEHRTRLMRMLSLEQMEGSMEAMPIGMRGAKIPLASSHARSALLVIPIAHLVDQKVEKIRLDKLIRETEEEKTAIAHRLQNQDFLAKAPGEIVRELEERFQAKEHRLIQLRQAFSALEDPLP
jgi:valyl-tRNA synthetase